MLTETEENATPRAPSYNLSVNVKTQVFQEKVLPFASALPSLLNWISQATSDDQNYTHFSVSMGRLWKTDHGIEDSTDVHLACSQTLSDPKLWGP